jgi:hypothetical protein
MRPTTKLFFLSVLLVIGMTLSSFQNKTFHSSIKLFKKFQADSSLVTQKVRTQLGKSQYYIQKPLDCAVKLMAEKNNYNDYIILPITINNSVLWGYCGINFSSTAFKPIAPRKNERIFKDTILKQEVTISETTIAVDLKNGRKGNEIHRLCEFTANGINFRITCVGYSKSEIERYYNIAKSLSN